MYSKFFFFFFWIGHFKAVAKLNCANNNVTHGVDKRVAKDNALINASVKYALSIRSKPIVPHFGSMEAGFNYNLRISNNPIFWCVVIRDWREFDSLNREMNVLILLLFEEEKEKKGEEKGEYVLYASCLFTIVSGKTNYSRNL